MNHSTLTVTRVIVKPQLDISGSTECSFTNKKLQYAAVSQSTLGGSFGRPRLSNCLAQSASVEREREARAVSDGSRREGGRGAGGRRLDDGARPASVHSRQESIHRRVCVHERRTGVSGAQRGAGTERQGRRATPRAACANGRSESRVRSVFALGRTGAREGAGETMGVFLRVVAGHARKRSSPAAPPARLP